MAPVDTGIRNAVTTTEDLLQQIDGATHAGSRARQDRHTTCRATARERVERLLDEGSFVELDAVAHNCAEPVDPAHRGEATVTGYGTVDGRPVAVFCQRLPVFGAGLDEFSGKKIAKVMDFALKTGCPLIGIHDATDARFQASTAALGVQGEIFRRNVHASGVIPQISLITGSCTGSAVLSTALTDFVVMVDRASRMFLTGPDVAKAVTGQEVAPDELGTARSHSSVSGVAHHLAADEEDAVEYVQALLSYLPSNNLEEPPVNLGPADIDTSTDDVVPELDEVVPDTANQPYDMCEVIEHVLDDSEFLQTQSLFAPNIITGFGRVEGHPVGIVANQPLHIAGCLDIDASEKAARLIRTCDAFNLPVITFVDVPGFRPGAEQERSGVIRRCSKLVYAYAEASVPLITLVTRKAYGGAYEVMGSKHLGADLNLAWPTAQIAVMGAHDAVALLHTAAPAETGVDLTLLEGTCTELAAEYEAAFLNPYPAAELGFVDAVIRPSQTRQHIIRGLRALRAKRETLPPKKHGNIPL